MAPSVPSRARSGSSFWYRKSTGSAGPEVIAIAERRASDGPAVGPIVIPGPPAPARRGSAGASRRGLARAGDQPGRLAGAAAAQVAVLVDNHPAEPGGHDGGSLGHQVVAPVPGQGDRCDGIPGPRVVQQPVRPKYTQRPARAESSSVACSATWPK